METYEQAVPVFINPDSGSASGIIEQLRADQRLAVHALPVARMEEAMRRVIQAGAPRILVAGGDGTIALAVNVLAGTNAALGIIPGGTLNHFAQRMGIPADTQEALELALNGTAQPMDVGRVNDKLFINTSSVGAYVSFVRTRNKLERRMSYHLASVLAGLRRLWRLRSARFSLDGRQIRSPLVFVGVGERELMFPTLGQNRDDGQNGLHLIALRTHNRLETLQLAFNALLRGIDPLSRAKQVEERMLDSLELTYRHRRRHIHVAVDGELLLLDAPLRYQYVCGAVRIIRR